MSGRYKPITSKAVRVGDTILHQHEDYTVITCRPRAGTGPRLILESVEDRSRSSMNCVLDRPVFRVELPKQNRGPARDWTMARGDVVVYPDPVPMRTVAAIRHNGGWHSTVGPQIPLADYLIMMDVVRGPALIVRNVNRQPHLKLGYPYLTGSVIAVHDPAVSDPSVWVRTRRDLWRSSTGVEISDSMVDYEAKRDTYRLLWRPER